MARRLRPIILGQDPIAHEKLWDQMHRIMVHGLMVIPHGHSTPAGLHFSLAQSPLLTPIQEYLVKWNAINPHFLANPVTPQSGAFTIPTQPGLGMDLDPAKIEAQTEVYA